MTNTKGPVVQNDNSYAPWECNSHLGKFYESETYGLNIPRHYIQIYNRNQMTALCSAENRDIYFIYNL